MHIMQRTLKIIPVITIQTGHLVLLGNEIEKVKIGRASFSSGREKKCTKNSFGETGFKATI